MTTESAQDAFERRYMGQFRALVARFGIVVTYERDRAARDIGVHFTRKLKSDDEKTTGSLVWFQVKGLQTKTLSRKEFSKRETVRVRIRVRDLQFWYRANGPTYLAIYVESVNQFLVWDVVSYVEKTFGKKIFSLKQKSMTIEIPTSSVLDDHAFGVIMRRGDAQEWSRVLNANEREIQLCLRDVSVLWRLGTAKKRKVEHKLVVTDWQSKMRGEVELLERPTKDEAEWVQVRGHWQFMFSIEDLASSYPYLDLQAFDVDRQDDIEFWGNEDDEPFVFLDDGSKLFGTNCAWEYNQFELRPKLNATGRRLWTLVKQLLELGLVEEPLTTDSEMIDVAPWHQRLS